MDTRITLTAHRGYRQKFPENTMTAFREALKLDIDGIETDVRMTCDREIVVIHDAKLDRTTDMTGYVCDKTLEQVRRADAGIKFGEQFRGEKIPTLKELLELIRDRKDIKLLLELKDYPEEYGDFAYVSCERSLALCKEYGVWGEDRLTIITFSTALCSWIKKKHAADNIKIHGFYPQFKMRGYEKECPYPYYDEVCLFCDRKGTDGKPFKPEDPVVDKQKFDDFRALDIKPCVYFAWDVNEEHYRRAFENGAIGFVCDDAYTCGIILDKIGARKLKKK